MSTLMQELQAHTHHSAIQGAIKQLVSLCWRRCCMQLVSSCLILALVALSLKFMPTNNPGPWLRLSFWAILIVGVIALGIDQRIAAASHRVIRRNELTLTAIRIYRDVCKKNLWYADFAGNTESGEFSIEFRATWRQIRLVDQALRRETKSTNLLTGPPSSLFG